MWPWEYYRSISRLAQPIQATAPLFYVELIVVLPPKSLPKYELSDVLCSIKKNSRLHPLSIIEYPGFTRLVIPCSVL
jgi:hypothetical protein